MPEPLRRGRRLIFNDGTTVEDGEAGYDSGALWIRLPGYTMQQAIAIVFEAWKVERIEFQYGEMEDVYEGFTVCKHMMTEEGRIAVCLVKG